MILIILCKGDFFVYWRWYKWKTISHTTALPANENAQSATAALLPRENIYFVFFCWAYWWFNKFVFAYSKVWLHSFCNIIAMSICYTQNCTYLILILLCVIFSNHTIRFIHCTTMFIWANQLVTFLMNIINNIFSVYS